MKKRILFITPSLCQGGLEHSLIMMLKLLNRKKYELYLYTYLSDLSLASDVPENVIVKNDLLNRHYYRKPKAAIYRFASDFFRMINFKQISDNYDKKLKETIHQYKILQPYDYYKSIQFDVVVSNAIGMATEMAVCINAKKRFVFFRSSVDLHHEENSKLFPKYDGIIAVSQGVKDMLCSSYENIEDKVFVLENFVDAEQIITKANQPLPNGFLPEDNKLILCTCGRFSEEKGFDLAVESANLLKKNNVDFIWCFIGDGVLRDALEKQISEYSLEDNIFITGYVKNPFPYIKACDIYIQPSYHESYGRTIKEAIILGKPVVSTDTVGGHTILEEGKYGEIVDIIPETIVKGILLVNKKNNKCGYAKYDIKENQNERIRFINELEKLID